jgi:hypothetical protein
VNTGPERSRGGDAPSIAVALVGIALTLAAFAPGLMSFDSAVQFAQARGALPLDDVHPPLMSLMWRAFDAVWPGPGGLFCGFVAAWWGGLWLLLRHLDASPRVRALLLFAIGAWPATWLMLAHLWKDVAMTVALLLAAAATLAWRRSGRRGAACAAVLLLAAACAFRHNGLFAALVLLPWLAWPRAGAARGRAVLGFVAAATLLVATPPLLLHATGAQRVQPWSVVLLWDLAALSLVHEQVLLPQEFVAADLTLDDVRAGFQPWANPALFAGGKIRVSFDAPLDRGEQALLLRRWASAIAAEPSAYVAHRARLARYLLLGFPREVPAELVYVAQRLVRDGIDYVPPPLDVQTPLWRAFALLRATPLFAGAAYLLLALLAAAASLRRRCAPPTRAAVIALAASAWANALPLLLISGSAEFRYLTWTALAALLAAAFAACGVQPADRSARIG